MTDDLEHPECDPTCPRQIEHTFASCECGGARRQFEETRETLANRGTPAGHENRPTVIPEPRRPEILLDDDEG